MPVIDPLSQNVLIRIVFEQTQIEFMIDSIFLIYLGFINTIPYSTFGL
jgi:hypothetical protein